MIGQCVAELLGGSIDSREKIDLWLLQIHKLYLMVAKHKIGWLVDVLAGLFNAEVRLFSFFLFSSNYMVSITYSNLVIIIICLNIFI